MTTNIKNWSTTAASNNAAPPNGWPEGQAPSTVNNTGRQNMADIRAWYEDATFIDLGHTPAYSSATKFIVSGDQTGFYTDNRPLSIADATAIYASVISATYSAPNTTVTIETETGSLSTAISTISVGLFKPDHLLKILPTHTAIAGYPFGWRPTDKVLDFGLGSIADMSNIQFTANTYYDTNNKWRYKSATYAQKLILATDTGAMAYQAAPSGSASASASFSTYLQIENAGTATLATVASKTTSGAANVFTGIGGELQKSTSSQRYKRNIETLKDSYADAALKMRPVIYESAMKDNATKYVGLVAEEVAQVSRELVTFKDGQPESVAYDRIVPLLINLIQRQQASIEALESRVTGLER